MTACFMAVPLLLEESFQFTRESHWKLYLGVFFVSLILMGPFTRPSANESKLQFLHKACLALLFLCLIFLGFSSENLYWFIVSLCLFFTAFNLLEALLPSLLSLVVDERSRAKAMGMLFYVSIYGGFFWRPAFWFDSAIFGGISSIFCSSSLTFGYRRFNCYEYENTAISSSLIF